MPACMLNTAKPTARLARSYPRCRGVICCELHSAYRLSRKEQLRRDEKPVFTFERWVSHRNTARYARHMLGLACSSTLTGLLKPISLLTLQAALAGALETLNEAYNVFPPVNFHISESPFELTSFALSLLLVFRTDSSYARYDEALKTWNSVQTCCTSFIRYGNSWVDDVLYSSLFSKWAAAYARSLKAYVTEGNDYKSELKAILSPHELARVVADESPPHFILQVLASLLHEAHLPRGKDTILMEALNDLAEAVDVFNRILKHPIPLPYTRHTSRFMIIWLGILPFALWPSCGWAVIPITGVISFLLLGIDEIAVQIEEPFGIMHLEEFCQSVEKEGAVATARQGEVSKMLNVAASQGGVSWKAAAARRQRDVSRMLQEVGYQGEISRMLDGSDAQREVFRILENTDYLEGVSNVLSDAAADREDIIKALDQPPPHKGPKEVEVPPVEEPVPLQQPPRRLVNNVVSTGSLKLTKVKSTK